MVFSLWLFWHILLIHCQGYMFGLFHRKIRIGIEFINVQAPNPALNSDAAATKSLSPSVFVISRLQQSFR